MCVCKQAFHISGHTSKSKCYYNTKLSAYYIYVMKKVSVDFQIYISVSLKKILRKLLSPSLWQTQSKNFTRIIEGPRALFSEKYKGSLTLKLLWNFSLSPHFFYTGWYILFYILYSHRYSAQNISPVTWNGLGNYVQKLFAKHGRQSGLSKKYIVVALFLFLFFAF